MNSIHDKGEKMKISVVGSINMDQTVVASKIPQRGETVQGLTLSFIPGGKGANQAVAMARLGADVEMFGCVGNDDNGARLIENLEKNGVKADNVKRIVGVPTGLAIITVGDNDNTIVVVGGANNCVDCVYIDSIRDELLKSDYVVLQHEIPTETVGYVLDICHKNGIKTVLNPAPARKLSEAVWQKATWITPNVHEARTIFGENVSTEDALRQCPGKMVVTLGEKGVAMSKNDGSIVTIPARRSKVVDTTGAGDTLNGAFCFMLAENATPEEALQFANAAAGLSVEKLGAQAGMPTRSEVERALLNENGSEYGG